MTRATKNPEERKNEILDAAIELFREKGFEQTAVSDIVKKVGVAQGLFYYYFKCKDEILNAIAEKLVSLITKGIRDIAGSQDLNAVEKIHKMIEELFEALGLKKKGLSGLINQMHKEENSVFHQRIARKMVDELIPVVTGVVKQGMEEGFFNTDYPDEVCETLLMWAGLMHNTIRFPIEDTRSFETRVRAIEDMVERLLGAKKGTMQFVKYVDRLRNEELAR